MLNVRFYFSKNVFTRCLAESQKGSVSNYQNDEKDKTIKKWNRKHLELNQIKTRLLESWVVYSESGGLLSTHMELSWRLRRSCLVLQLSIGVLDGWWVISHLCSDSELIAELSECVIKTKCPAAHMNQLLKILREFHSNLPADCRSLCKTPRRSIVLKCDSGTSRHVWSFF